MKRAGKKILFRADGNGTIGLGHLYRLFALVEMLKTDFQCVLMTSAHSATEVIPKDYAVLTLPDDLSVNEEPDWISKSFLPEDYLLILDGYQFDSQYQKRLHKKGFKLAYIDDFAKIHFYADLVINHAPGITPEDYQAEPYTSFALGTQYAILRPEFLRAAENKRSIDSIREALVCFGGADPQDLTHKVVGVLLEFPQLKRIHVVLGGANANRKEIEDERVKTYRNLSAKKLVEVMENCQLGIIPSSTILFEVCAVKMMVISGYYVDNQEKIYRGFLNEQAIFGMGDFSTATEARWIESVKKVLNDKNRNEQLSCQQKMFDNEISRRFKNAIRRLC